MSHVSESLAGRALYLEMSPMTRRELSGDLSHEPFICRTLVSGTIKRSGRFPSIRSVDITTGGMPPVAAIHENSSFWFKGFEQKYLERDMRSLAQVADLVEFQLFLRIIALRIGSILNTSELGRDAKISSHTSARYLRLLETLYTIFKIRPFLQSKVSRLVKSSKVYLSDSGLAAHLRGTNSGVTDKNHDGSLLENYVAQNLRAVLAARCPEANLYYWNVQGRFEVDFIIEYGDRTVAIEIKWGTRWTANDLVGLRHFMEKTSSCILGILACNVPEVVPLSDRLFAVPIALLLS